MTLPAGERSSRRPDIQGLRALAVTLVVVFHARLAVPGGFTGVDVFFAISGFVITAMLLRQHQVDPATGTPGRISMGTFYLRRYLRLTPALALVVAVVAIGSFFLQGPLGDQQATAATGIGALLLSANFVIAHAAGDYFAPAAVHNPLLNTWSLSVEEQFYLVFPSLLVLAWYLGRKAKRTVRIPALIVLAVTVGSLVLSLLWTFGSGFAEPMTSYFGGPQTFAFYSPLTRAWEFGIGALLALALPHLPALPRWLREGLGALGLALLVVAAFGITDAMPWPGWLAAIPVVGTCAVIWGASPVDGGTDTVLARVLGWRPFTFIGDTSYSWYLWHWPLIVFAAVLWPSRPWVLVVAAAVSFLPAWLSYRFVEQPIRVLRPRTKVRTALVIVLTSGIPIALCAGLLIGANANWGKASAAPAAAVGDGAPTLTDDGGSGLTANTTVNDLRGQHEAFPACVNTDVGNPKCTFGTGDKGTVLVLGDSQAYSLADGVIAAAESLGYRTTVSSRTGCPFLGIESSGTHDDPCRSWQKQALAYALKMKPAAVIIANRSGGYVHPEIKWRTPARSDGSAATSIEEAAKLWRTGFEDIVTPLADAGIPILVIDAVPEMPEFTDQHSLFAQAFGQQSYEVTRESAEKYRAPAFDAEHEVLASLPSASLMKATTFDPMSVLCDPARCVSAKNDTVYYQDADHLSLDGAQALAPGLQLALSKLLPNGASS